MTTAVDTNILLDVLIQDPQFAAQSESALSSALAGGPLIICEAVYAELAGHFPGADELERFLGATGLRLRASDETVLFAAGRAWREYSRRRPARASCPQCGAALDVQCNSCTRVILPRPHLITDFLIGAHAQLQAGRLLTRDHGYYGAYFPSLALSG